MRVWSPAQDDMMREFYPNHTMHDLIRMLDKSEPAIYSRSFTLGVKKSKEYLDSPAAFRFRREQTEAQKENHFKKGSKSWNKGIKGVIYEGCKKTWFGKGHKPANYKPIGSVRVQEDGYLLMKMADGMHQWKLLQRVVWQRLNGVIPKGTNLIFLDGDRQNIKITNLSLYTKAQNMQRNTYHNYPKELALAIQLRGAITRQINKRAKNEQHKHT